MKYLMLPRSAAGAALKTSPAACATAGAASVWVAMKLASAETVGKSKVTVGGSSTPNRVISALRSSTAPAGTNNKLRLRCWCAFTMKVRKSATVAFRSCVDRPLEKSACDRPGRCRNRTLAPASTRPQGHTAGAAMHVPSLVQQQEWRHMAAFTFASGISCEPQQKTAAAPSESKPASMSGWSALAPAPRTSRAAARTPAVTSASWSEPPAAWRAVPAALRQRYMRSTCTFCTCLIAREATASRNVLTMYDRTAQTTRTSGNILAARGLEAPPAAAVCPHSPVGGRPRAPAAAAALCPASGRRRCACRQQRGGRGGCRRWTQEVAQEGSRKVGRRLGEAVPQEHIPCSKQKCDSLDDLSSTRQPDIPRCRWKTAT